MTAYVFTNFKETGDLNNPENQEPNGVPGAGATVTAGLELVQD